jgi:predicted RNA-binding protein associated with RNAse of E/G family
MAAPSDRRIVEVKRTLDAKVIEYAAEPLVVEDRRAVLLYRIDVPEVIAGGRMTLRAGTLSFGYFWADRSYNVYHFLHAGKTLAYYVNVGRLRSIGDAEVVWDDYAVDVLATPDGSVEVLDEDEVPETTAQPIRDFIADATAQVLAEIGNIIREVESETQSLGATIDR